MLRQDKRLLRVFLCHASGDKPPVRDLYKRLTAEGVDAWLDKEKLLPGQDWRLEIPKAVQEADVVVVCLSNKSITKEGYVQKEIKFALDSAEEKPEGAIFLIPARLEDCPVPERLSRWQWVDLYEENGFIQLLRSLKLRALAVGAAVEPNSYIDSDKESERRLEQLYTEGLAAFYTEDWERACQRFRSILSENPNHKAASEKLAEAERQRSLATLYAQATEAHHTGNWPVAISALDELTKKSADYKDAASLLKDARKRAHLQELYAEAGKLHAAQQWQAVVKVFEQISILEPNFPDANGLLTSAQQEVAEIKRIEELNNLYAHALREMDAGHWREARKQLEQVHKAQTGFFETERLLRKVEDEIAREDKKREQNDEINTLYEQAHGLLRSKKWRNALEKMEEIDGLDEHFPDADGIVEKAQKEIAREEQEAERQNKLAAMYAEAVRLLKEEKYQEALEKWQEVKGVDPKYPDRQWVQRTAKRKLGDTRKRTVVPNDWKSKFAEFFLQKEAVSSTRPQVFTGWLILFVAISWGVGRAFIEALGRITNFFRLGVTVGTTEIVLGTLGLIYGMTIWLMLRFLKVEIDTKRSFGLIAGWLAGFLIVPVIGWNFSGLTNESWSFGYIFAGMIASFSTGLVLRSLKGFQSLKQTIVLVIGMTVAISAGERSFEISQFVRSIDLFSVRASLPLGLGSFISGFFCAWILFIKLQPTDEAYKQSRELIRFFIVLALFLGIGFTPRLLHDPFAGAIGMWEGTDNGDHSRVTMSVGRFFFTKYEFIYEDQQASICNGAPAQARFSGRPVEFRLVSLVTFTCISDPDMKINRGYIVEYVPNLDQLTDSDGVTWYRMK